MTIGTDLAYGAITKTVGGWRHLRAGHVDLRLSWWLAAGSMPGSVLGVIAVNWLHDEYGDAFEPYLLGAVAVALAFASSATLYRALFRPGLIAKERDAAVLQRRFSQVGTVAIGFVLGFVLGLTSVGSGALVGLVLILLYKLKPRRVVGTDVFHAAVLLWTAGLANLAFGNVDFGLMGTILLGSLPGVWIGTALVPYVPVVGLRYALGIILAAASLGRGVEGGGGHSARGPGRGAGGARDLHVDHPPPPPDADRGPSASRAAPSRARRDHVRSRRRSATHRAACTTERTRVRRRSSRGAHAGR